MKSFHSLKVYLARQYAKFYSPETFIGITGSVGKTATAVACAGVLSQKYKTLVTKSNQEHSLDISSILLKLNPSVKRVVLEMGIKTTGDMDHHLYMVRPKTVILTKITPAYSNGLGSINEVIEEKGKLVESLSENSVVLLNGDDPYSKKLAENCKGNVFYYGMDPKNCTVWATNPKIENFSTTFELNHGVERVKVNFQPLGMHQIYPALAAALLGIVNGIPITRIKLALEKIIPSEHRLQPVAGPNGSILLDDTYDCSPVALDGAIDALLQIPARRRVLVLGEMKELGAYSERLHRQVAQKIYKEKLDFVFLGQGEAKIVADELKSLGFWEERLESNLANSQIVSKLLKTLGKGDICLIKGAKVLRLDEVVKRIAKKA